MTKLPDRSVYARRGGWGAGNDGGGWDLEGRERRMNLVGVHSDQNVNYLTSRKLC